MEGHGGEKLKGRAKKAVGDLTGDKGLQREGALDEASANTKEAVDKAADKIKRDVNPKR